MDIKTLIKNSIQETGHQPFLFVGSGLSKRYLGTEKWDELLKKFCTEFSDNDFQYNYYENNIETNIYYGQHPEIARMLERDYNNTVLTSEKYRAFRSEHQSELYNGKSALKIAIAEYLSSFQIDDSLDEIKLIKKLGKRSISGIITTNYDTMLEVLFPNFETYIGQDELIFAKVSGIGEIYKIHGSVTRPESLVITTQDYEYFEAKSAYLIAKLLTIFLEYPIVFLGYSLNDRNIRNVFETITDCLPQDKVDKFKNRLIFVNYSKGDVISETSLQFKNGRVVNMMQVSTTDFSTIYEAIFETKSKYNPSVLRSLRRDIYELANSAKPSEKLVATGFENLDDISDAHQFVLGVGVVRNGLIIKAEQLYEDIIFDNQYFDPKYVVEEYLPELLKRNSGGLPMYKYLSQYSGAVFERVKENTLKYTKIDDFLNKFLRNNKKTLHSLYDNLSVQKVIEIEGFDNAYKKLVLLDESEIEVDALHEYIVGLMKSGIKLTGNSELKRLIRIYDLLKYRN